MFMLDIETLAVESTAVVLSVSIIPFEFDEVVPDEQLTPDKMNDLYNEFRDQSITVKFDIKEQEAIGRLVDDETVAWWRKQSDIAKKVSLIPAETDLSVKEGIDILRDFINDNGGDKQTVWVRGTLDQMALESLCRSFKIQPLIHYSQFKDVRTAIDLISESSRNGYCRMKGGFNQNHVVKHVPANDCAFDIMMMLYHE